MEFTSRQFADIIVAAPVGRVDHASAATFEAELAPLLLAIGKKKSAIVLDFAGIEYISSVGLRTLMIAARQMRESEAKIGIAGLQPVVAEIIAISRFDRILAVFPSVRDALQAFSPPALAAFDAASG